MGKIMLKEVLSDYQGITTIFIDCVLFLSLLTKFIYLDSLTIFAVLNYIIQFLLPCRNCANFKCMEQATQPSTDFQ